MLKQIPLALIVLSLTAAGGCKSEQLSSDWADTAITIDGAYADWTGRNMEYFDDAQVGVAVRNDAEYLYVMVATRQDRAIRLLKRAGLRVWLDSSGKKKDNLSLLYFGDLEPDTAKPDFEPRAGEFPEKAMEEMREKRQMMKGMIRIDGEAGESLIPDDGSQGPWFAADEDKGLLTYEMRFPLTSDGVAAVGLNAAPGDKISIGVEPGMTMQQPEGMRPGGGMRGGGGMGGGRGGGMRGGGMGGGKGGGGMRGEDAPSAPEKKWFDIKLAVKTSNLEKGSDI